VIGTESTPTVGSRRLSPRLLPAGTAEDAKVLLVARAIRAFGDGFVSVLLPVYLLRLGFDAVAVEHVVVTKRSPWSTADPLGLDLVWWTSFLGR